MAAVRRAFLAMFGTAEGVLPESSDLEPIARKVFDQMISYSGSARKDIRRVDLYRYLFAIKLGGVSEGTVNKMFDTADSNRSGSLDSDEFCLAVRTSYNHLLRKEAEDREEIPTNLVVPGSSRLNSLSGTHAFRMRVVRRASMRRLWDIFEELDLNKDSNVSLSEFKKYLQRSKPEFSCMASSIFHSMDKEKVGRVSFKQLLECLFPEACVKDISTLIRMARPQHQERPVQPDDRLMDEVRSIFDVYDDDRSGTLDVEEFVDAMQLAGFTEEEASEMFASIAANGSTTAEISFEEFEDWYIKSNLRAQRAVEEAAVNSDDDED